MKKIKICFIHGGNTFKNRRDYLHYLKTREVSLDKKVRWSGDYLDRALGSKFQCIRPRMPLQDNAKYGEWKIQFERYISYLGQNPILIGGSLGGIFLAQYLSENELPHRALAVYLVCPPFDGEIEGQYLAGGFKLKPDLSLLENNTRELYLLFSKDDEVVTVSHAEKYRNKLRKAKIVIYKSKKGHFRISTFPEIIRMIKKDAASL